MPYKNIEDERERQNRRRKTAAYKSYQKEYQQVNKKRLRIAADMRDWYNKTKNQRRVQLMFAAALARARRFDLPFTLEIIDIVIPEKCPVLGITLQTERTGRAQPYSPSLDRIVPEFGYIKGNVRVISMRANALKSDATLAELEAVVRYMREPMV